MPDEKEKKLKISTKEVANDLVKKHFPSIFANDLMPDLDGSEVGEEIWAIIGGKQKKKFKFPTSGGSRKMLKIPASCSVQPKDHPIIGELIQKQINANSDKIEGILKKTLEEMSVIKKKLQDDDDIVDDDDDEELNDDDDDDDDSEKEELTKDMEEKFNGYNGMVEKMKRKREKTSNMSPQFVKSLAATDEKASKVAKILETDDKWLKLVGPPPVLSVANIPTINPPLIPISKLSKMFVDAVEKDDVDVDENVSNTTHFLNNLKNMLAQQNPEEELKKTELLKKKNYLLEKRDMIDKELEQLEKELLLLVDQKKDNDLALYQEKLKLWESAVENLRNLNVEKRKALEKETEDKEKDWLSRLLNK